MRIERAGLRLAVGARLRARQPGRRPALPQLLGGLATADGPRRRHARGGQGGGAALEHADRRADAAAAARPTPCCAAWSAATTATSSTCATVIGLKPRHAHLGGDERADARRSTRCSSPTPSSTTSPSAEELADIAAMAAAEVRRFGLPPKVAFLSHSIFGSSQRASARRMRAARDLFVQRCPDVECDGEMHGDAALSESVRRGYLPETTLSGAANLLVLPNLDAANILFNVLKMTGGHGVTVGPMLLGAALPAHILTPSATVRRIVNMTALAVADAAEAGCGDPIGHSIISARAAATLPKACHVPRHQDRRHARPCVQRPCRAGAPAARRRRRGAPELQPRHGAGPPRPRDAGARDGAARGQAGGADGRPAGPEDPRRQVRRRQRHAGQRRRLRARRLARDAGRRRTRSGWTTRSCRATSSPATTCC